MSDQDERARAKLERAIENMAKTSTCLAIFDMALREERRRVWEEVAKGLEHKRAVLWEKKSVELFNYVIAWCRQQASEEEI